MVKIDVGSSQGQEFTSAASATDRDDHGSLEIGAIERTQILLYLLRSERSHLITFAPGRVDKCSRLTWIRRSLLALFGTVFSVLLTLLTKPGA